MDKFKSEYGGDQEEKEARFAIKLLHHVKIWYNFEFFF